MKGGHAGAKTGALPQAPPGQLGLCPTRHKQGLCPRPRQRTAVLCKPGDYRIRTDDPLLAKQVLYQLS